MFKKWLYLRILDEYNECNDKVKNAIGVPEYNSHLFRFPGGLAGGKYADIKQQSRDLLSQNDILNVYFANVTGKKRYNSVWSKIISMIFKLVKECEQENAA